MKSEELNVTKAMIILNTKHPSASSNVNEVIRAVLNSLFFFLQKDFARTKSTKSTKAQRHNQAKAQNATSKQK